MIQVKLDDNGDIYFENGYLEWVEETESVAQHIKNRLNFGKGTFKVFTNAGLPYKDYIAGKKDYNLAALVIKDWIQNTPEVNNVSEYNYSFNTNTRTLSVTYKVDTIYGVVDDEINILI